MTIKLLQLKVIENLTLKEMYAKAKLLSKSQLIRENTKKQNKGVKKI